MNAFVIRLDRIDAIEYVMPLKRPYGTARGITRAAGNFLVRISAEVDGKRFQGVGECQPRHNLTGDGDKRKEAAWGFLSAACSYLQGREIEIGERDTTLRELRNTMAGLAGMAESLALPRHRAKPFRGTLLGVEVALLDLVARVLGIEVADLLGKRRDEVSISISTISSANKMEVITRKVAAQERFPMTRVKGKGDVEYDLGLMREVARANEALGRRKPIWIDINEAHDFKTARRFVVSVASLMAEGELSDKVCIEGMLPKAEGDKLALLQKDADAACAGSGVDGLDLRIMPDEGLWDIHDLERLNALGGCRAINIKAPKAGGLLASLDLANAAVSENPDVHICIGGMVGTSDITTWALYSLAKALPRLDYITAVPPGNVEQRISLPLASFLERGSSTLSPQVEPGIGAVVDMTKLLPYVKRVSIFGDRSVLEDES